MDKNTQFDEQLIEQSFKKMSEQFVENKTHFFYLDFKDEKYIPKFDALIKKYLDLEFKKSGSLLYYKCDAHSVIELRKKIHNVLNRFNDGLIKKDENFDKNWLENVLNSYNFNIDEINHEEKDFKKVKEKTILKKDTQIKNKELTDKALNYDLKNFKTDWINFLTESFDIDNINLLKQEIDNTFKILQEKYKNNVIIYKGSIDSNLKYFVEIKSKLLHKDYTEEKVYDKNQSLLSNFFNSFGGNNFKEKSNVEENYDIIYKNFKDKNINFTNLKNNKVNFGGVKHFSFTEDSDVFNLKENMNEKVLNINPDNGHKFQMDKNFNFIVLFNLVKNYENIVELKQEAIINNEFKRISKLLDKKHYEEFLPEIVNKIKNYNSYNNTLEQKELGI